MNRYDDIINLPRPVSRTHLPMPLAARASQFAPFAALTGHEEAIARTARHIAEAYERHDNPKSTIDSDDVL
ncbi:MAG: hypothetical protein J6D01_04735 [Muribaculaceae bacterium]|jgi:hypothetical protein|nr:hypothetical protein [Muribaculaceae bacterium]